MQMQKKNKKNQKHKKINKHKTKKHKKHNKKENKKAVAKPLALHPFWNIVVAGQAKPPAQQSE